jgi:hypothetical protein
MNLITMPWGCSELSGPFVVPRRTEADNWRKIAISPVTLKAACLRDELDEFRSREELTCGNSSFHGTTIS